MSMHVPEELSREAADLKMVCDDVADSVADTVREMVGDPLSGQVLKMGADGTPTKNIDKKAEKAVLSSLKGTREGARFGDFTILSEEMGKKVVGENPRHFIYLDPLDGTFNAINGIPFYSVSIYITNTDDGRRTDDGCRFGYVFDLANGVRYYAEGGRGAWIEAGTGADPRQLRVSNVRSLTDFSITAYTARPRTRRIVPVADVVRRVRTLGSTSLELCFVACGKLDAFVDLRGGLRVVDVAAGNLIAEEAGGNVTDSRGKKIQLDDGMWQRRDLVVSNGHAHQKILDLVGGGRR